MKFIFGLILVTQTSTALALNYPLPTGRYGENRTGYGESPHDEVVQLTVLPDLIRVTDLKYKIPYELKLNEPGEQLLNPKLLEMLRDQPGSRNIARLIQKITISDVKVDDKGLITGNFNLYGESVSPFGKLSTVLQLGAQIVPKTCKVEWTQYVGVNPQNHSATVACVHAELGTHVGLVSLSTGGILNEQIERGIGMIGDFIFKLYSPVHTGAGDYYHRP